MTRITVNVDIRWLDAAQEVLGTPTKVATINEALRFFAVRKQAQDIIDAFDSVPLDLADADHGWRYGGGRDLSSLEADAREDQPAIA